MSPLVVIGRVVKPHGIRGELVVHVLSDVPDRFAVGDVVRLRGEPVTIDGARWHQGRLLLRFDAIRDRNDAELLRGAEIEAEAGDYDTSDTYYAHELVGMPVRADDGRDLGVVTDVVELPDAAGYDLLEVDLDGVTWLLPASDELVDVDVDASGTEFLVVVDPPAGLLPGDGDAAVTAAPDA